MMNDAHSANDTFRTGYRWWINDGDISGDQGPGETDHVADASHDHNDHKSDDPRFEDYAPDPNDGFSSLEVEWSIGEGCMYTLVGASVLGILAIVIVTILL